MASITFENQTFESQTGETVLQTLLRNNQQVPYGCKAGACQCCLMQSLENSPPISSQIGLKDSQQKQKYFLPCICQTENDMHVALSNTKTKWLEGEVIAKKPLSQNVIFLKLKSKEPLAFFAGQFVNLRHGETIRSYSIANIPNPYHELAFHLRILPKGKFSHFVENELHVGMFIDFSHAQGDCHYVEGQSEQSLLLVGTGTGLAPLYGIVCDALKNHNHQGEIHLFHGSRDESGLYFEKELRELEKAHANFHYTPCLSGEGNVEKYAKGRANDIALQQFPKLDDWRVYLCGQPEMVSQSKRQAYLQGASLHQIYADAFIS
jgi:NAD(P)H-flavin reductase/ferredoxin